MLFVDNEGTKFSLLRGLSENHVVDFFAEKFVEAEATIHAFTWLARVPSSCSIANPPSRGVTSCKLLEGALDVSADVRIQMLGLVEQLKKLGEKGCVPTPRAK